MGAVAGGDETGVMTVVGSDVEWVIFAGHGSIVAGVDVDFQNCHENERLNTNWDEVIGCNFVEEEKFRTE